MIHVSKSLRAIGFGCLGVALAVAMAGCSVSASAGPTEASCAPDTTVSCTGSATGFSCTGSDQPEDSDSSLTCSVPISGNAGSTLYCCVSGFAFSSSTCAPDSTVTGCEAGSYGFSCTGSDTPDQTDSSLTCSTPVDGNAGSSLYCCTN
jgi:hypothetical protein